MTEQHLAVLKSFAVRPSRDLTPGVQHMAADLLAAGYVCNSADGWFATAKGCEALEQDRLARRQALAAAGN